MAIALVLAIIGMATNFGTRYIEGQLWMIVLFAQSLPYLSAVIGALVAHYAHEHPAGAPQAQPVQPEARAARAPQPVEASTAAT